VYLRLLISNVCELNLNFDDAILFGILSKYISKIKSALKRLYVLKRRLKFKPVFQVCI